MYLGYLDQLPAVPADLLPSPQEIIDQERIDRSSRGLNNPIFQPKRVDSAQLKEWLSENVVRVMIGRPCKPDHTYFRFQVINVGFGIHIDAYNRRIALNYLLQLGGEGIQTKVYDGVPKREVARMCLELHRWHYLITEIPHTADGVTGQRVALTITFPPEEEEQLFKIVGYESQVSGQTTSR